MERSPYLNVRDLQHLSAIINIQKQMTQSCTKGATMYNIQFKFVRRSETCFRVGEIIKWDTLHEWNSNLLQRANLRARLTVVTKDFFLNRDEVNKKLASRLSIWFDQPFVNFFGRKISSWNLWNRISKITSCPVCRLKTVLHLIMG